MSDPCIMPPVDWKALERGFQELAWWAAMRPEPKLPELIPGLPAENRRRLTDWREQWVGWKAGKAEALLHGLVEPNPYAV
jgi:hypothetical protein